MNTLLIILMLLIIGVSAACTAAVIYIVVACRISDFTHKDSPPAKSMLMDDNY